ncbi:hypothetical protein [Methanobrevibacter oralis]|uniref:Orotate phosphoribosyltransferase-like protein n=1 Tax=Methanobrevibacter oralis TaxID=66851 RepID=A0A166BU84_METOA|nr:hypothetical protein [Methanobrevibacter oralis]KZX13818.1 orotate phosphoribosyltransferase-like protein [Methanobrevibacter oralis]
MDENITKVHITEALTSVKIVELIDKYPNLEEITCAPSVYERTSNNYIQALEQLDIKVTKKYNWGAKSQSNGLEHDVYKLANSGMSAHEIAEKLDISLNRVYYLVKKVNNDFKFENIKKKHDHEKVKSLKEEGLNASQIAKNLDIPIRSVYYILNKK